MLPSMLSQFISTIQDTTLGYVINVQELTFAANEIQATYYVPFASFVCAMLLYWALSLAVEGGVRTVLRMAEARR